MSAYFIARGAHTDGAELALRFPLPHLIVAAATLDALLERFTRAIEAEYEMRLAP